MGGEVERCGAWGEGALVENGMHDPGLGRRSPCCKRRDAGL
ncbi:hypothetical protein Salmuc_03551 [Salipiger mucosus DSM 16094]|uniref:Uncharacterized protein n=1 Tax=Salipiger mucosus DSM 16094 TaxID=1123237 RepID=S9QAP0_9RHOB|nr:hypothetical protein Salmuc_03551 [Salipiger mucosus DSM 16094]